MAQLQAVATGVDDHGVRGVLSSIVHLIARDFDIEEVGKALKEKCVCWGIVQSDGSVNLATTIDPDATEPKFDLQILVKPNFPELKGPISVDRLNKPASWDFVCAKTNNAPSSYPALPGDEIYYFNSEGLKDNNPFLGKPHYEIEAALIEQHGEGSQEVRGIREVIKLYSDSLYGNLKPEENSVITKRLKELMLELGHAARAVIRDFDRDYRQNG